MTAKATSCQKTILEPEKDLCFDRKGPYIWGGERSNIELTQVR